MAKQGIFRKYKFLTGKYQGKIFRVYYSDHPTKKYEVDTPTGTVYHGQKNAWVAPGKPKGQRYCNRSYFIKSDNDITSKNFWSRLNWSCQGTKTVKGQTFRTPVGVVKIID